MKAKFPTHRFILAVKLFFIGLFIAAGTGLHANGIKKSIPKGFVENKGQIVDQFGKTNEEVKYLLSTNGLNVQLRGNGFSYDTYQAFYDKGKPDRTGLDSVVFRHITYSFHRIDIEFIGANPHPQLIASEAAMDYTNYYNQGNGGNGITGVRHFSKVTYKNIYPGIDLEFIKNPGSDKPLEYNFVVQPGADISQIRWRYHGSMGTHLAEGKVLVKTTHGSLTETIPHTFEKETGKSIDLKYTTDNDGVYGFETKHYDRTKTLVIDPVPDLRWATYLGGIENDGYNGICMVRSGNIFASGCGNSFSGLATLGAYQVNGQGKVDGIVSKFSPSGELLWSTVFGGSEDDGADARPAADAAGNVFITGVTASNGIATPGAYQTSWAGPAYSSYLAKFNASGALQWATYFDGNQQDITHGVAVDNNGNVLLTGSTNSDSAIATTGADQPTFFGDYDIFLAKFTNSGNLSWSTYLGGGGSEGASSVTTDLNGNIFIAGSATDANGTAQGISTAGAQAYNGGQSDVILAKYSSNGVKQWVTYFGGTVTESAESVITDANGNVFIAGWSNSTGLASSGAFQQTLGGTSSAIIAKYTTNGARLWSTYYGEECFASGLSSNEWGDVFVCGATVGSNLIATQGAPKTSYSGGGFSIPPFPGFPGIFIAYYDGFVAKISSSGALQWGTYFGGNMEDRAEDIVADHKGHVYVSGYTASDSGITTPGAHQTTFVGGRNECWIAAYEDLVGGNNASASALASPTAAFCADSVSVKLEVENRGNNSIDSLKVDWELNGVWQNTISVNVVLAPLGKTIVDLGRFYFPANTNQVIKAWTSMPNGVVDTVRSNDTLLVNLRPALNGNYTIGGDTPDYANFNEAIADLNAYGVCGPVNFDVRTGTYQETLHLKAIKGSSATNFVQFSGAGVDSTLLHYSPVPAKNALIIMNKAKHIVFRDMSMRSDATAILMEGADSNSFINLNISTDSLQSIYHVIHVNRSSYNLLDSLVINWGENGIRLEGDSSYARDNIIQNCRFEEQSLSGIYALSQNRLVLHHNTFSGANPIFAGAILLGISNFEVSANAFYNGGFNGSGLNSLYYDPTYPSLIVNNMISVSSPALVMADSRNISIYHNSLQSLAQSSGSGVLEINGNKGGINIRNNHIVNESSSGVAYLIFSTDTGTFTGLDYNNYFPTTAGFSIQGLISNDLNDLKIKLPQFNQNSYSSDPQFASAKDLHSPLRLAGVSLGILKDFDGEYRCPQLVHIGADDNDHGFIPGVTSMQDSVYLGYTAEFLNNLAAEAVSKGLVFEWFVDDVKLSDSVNFSHLFTALGIYKLKLQVASCAYTDSSVMTVEVVPARPLLTLIGSNPDSLRVFETYLDSGVKAVNVLGYSITHIVIKNKPDTAVTGMYEVWYIAEDSLGNRDSVSRMVKVYDDIAPELTLIGNDTIILEVFQSYMEPGILVTDNYCTNGKWKVDGVVDSSQAGFYQLVYSSIDCEGNADTITRWVKVSDTEPPVLNLNGADTIILEVYSAYIDAGASVTDNYCAGNVLMSGTVDTSLLGNYTLTYSSTDCEGNAAVAINRVVQVVDRTAPTITLNGSLNIQLSRWQQFVNPGYQMSDNYYDASELDVDTLGDWVNSSEEGVYFIQYQVSDPSGNTGLSAQRSITVSGTNSLKTASGNQNITIYPNPGKGIFILNFEEAITSESTVIVSDVNGKEVFTTTTNQQQTLLPLDTLADGMYQVKVIQGMNAYILRITVLK